MHKIIALIKGTTRVIEYEQLATAFGDDLELMAAWCAEVNEPDRCPLEFVIAWEETE